MIKKIILKPGLLLLMAMLAVLAMTATPASAAQAGAPLAWTPVGSSCFSPGRAYYESLSVYDGTPYVAFQDEANSGGATVMEYTGSGPTGWQDVGSPDFSGGNAVSESLAVCNGTPYVAYQDSGGVTVMEYTDTGLTGWQAVGSPDFAAGASLAGGEGNQALCVYNGTPYVVCCPAYGSSTYGCVVMEYTSGSWKTLGGAPTSGSPAYGCLSIDNGTGTLYLAYASLSFPGAVYVLEYNGGSWQTAGDAPASGGTIASPTPTDASDVSLSVSNGTPYVTFENGYNYNAVVMVYTGGSWQPAGSPNISSGYETFESLCVYNGTPYVAYDDYYHNCVVMEYTGAGSTDWQEVCNSPASPYGAVYESLFVYNGTPYVAFEDGTGASYKATVMYVAPQTPAPNINNQVYAGSDVSVSGTATPGASIVLSVDGAAQPKVTADASTGVWTVSGLTLFVGDIISVTAQAPGDAVSEAVTATVTTQPQTPAPIINPVYNGATSVSGTATAGASIVLIVNYPSGTAQPAVLANGNGAWTVSNLTLTSDELISVTAQVTGDAISNRAYAYVSSQSQTPTPTITTNPIYAGATSVSGTAAANASIVLSVSGTAQPAVTAGGSGNWTVSGLSLSAGDTVSVTAQVTRDAVSQVATAIVQASPPTVVSAVTSTDGSKITVTFSKAMDAPPAAPAGFGVWGMTGGFAEFPTGVVLDSDTSAYDLTLSTPVAYGDEVSLSYNGEVVVQSEDGGTLAGFNEQSVTNNVAQASPPTGSATIDPGAGGTISLPSGQASVSIPAGALQGTTGLTVTITQVSATAPPGFKFLGTVYQFTVGGLDSYTFNIPVTLTFSFNPSRVPSGVTPAIYYYDDTTGQWVNIGGTVNWTNDTITVTVDHFTNYAVMYPTFTTPGGGSGGSESFPLLSVPPSYFEGLK